MVIDPTSVMIPKDRTARTLSNLHGLMILDANCPNKSLLFVTQSDVSH